MTAFGRLTLLGLVLAPALALAQGAPSTDAGSAAGFAQHKAKELAHIAAHMQALQGLQSCVQAATDHAAIKVCHANAHAAMGHPG